MEQYIPKSAVFAKIRGYINNAEAYLKYHHNRNDKSVYAFEQEKLAMCELLSSLDTLEVKEVDNWHLQSKEDIYDVVKDWGLYAFACIMKDGTIQRFNGCLDEDCEGHVHVHIDGLNDDYDNVDDIVYWIEMPTKVQKEK